MELQEYLSQNEFTHAEFAEELGVSRVAVTLATAGLDAPRPVGLRLSLKIQWESGGVVQATDLPISDETRATLALIRDLVAEGETFK